MTFNEIIKAMDEFAALQAKATHGPWFVCENGFGSGKYPPVPTVYATDNELRYIAKCKDVYLSTPTNDLANAHSIAASRSIPAAEAAALIREMREMLRKYNEKTQNDPVALCLICERLTCDTDCKLAQILKD